MIGWDTNVLLRLIFADDEEQMRRARENLAKFAGDGIRIDRIVLVELVWVLRSRYNQDRAEIAGLLDRIMTMPELEIDSRGPVMRALQRYRTGPADFADYLLGAVNEAAGAMPTYTFDKKAADAAGFVEVE